MLIDDSSVESYAPPIPTTNVPIDLRYKFWKKPARQYNLEQYPHEQTMFSTSKIKIEVNMAIVDASATGNFVLPFTPVTEISPATRPLVIKLLDGETIKSTNTWKLAIPCLPDEEKIAHIVPGLVQSSLVFLKFPFDTGWKVIYKGHTCNVYFNANIVWKGMKEATLPIIFPLIVFVGLCLIEFIPCFLMCSFTSVVFIDLSICFLIRSSKRTGQVLRKLFLIAFSRLAFSWLKSLAWGYCASSGLVV